MCLQTSAVYGASFDKIVNRGDMMGNFDYMTNLHKQMQKYLQSMEPVSKQLLEAITENQKNLLKIIAPYQEMSVHIEKLHSAISLPNIAVDNIRRLSESMAIQLPRYTYKLQLSSTFLDAIKDTCFIIPEHLIDFKEINLALSNSTDQLYNSLNALKETVAEKMITIDAIPEFLIRPHNSVSAHFNTLKKLKFYVMYQYSIQKIYDLRL